jgi:integrase
MNKLNFTKTALTALPSATPKTPGKPCYDTYYDEGQSNLCLFVTDKGNKTFYIRRTVEGKLVRFKLGRFPDMTVEQARKETQKYLGRIVQGENPQEARRAEKAESTLNAFFEVYLERHSKVHKKSWKYDEEQYERHIHPNLGDKQLSKVTREEIENLFLRLTTDNGKSTANHILSMITALYNKAVEWDYYPMDRQIPTRFIKKHREKSRERFLDSHEIPRFMEALQQEENETFRDFIMMALFTGARKTNILSMQWKDINWDRKEWRIPETKNGESYTVPLIDEAIDILNNRRELDNKWVFAGTGTKGHFADPKRPWQRLLERAEIENLTMHDLRRTLGSYQAMSGASPFIIGKSLGHKSMKATQVYARMDNEPVRASISTAVKTILQHNR